MANICDRTPCNSLMYALGRYIFGNTKSKERFTMWIKIAGGGHEVATIEYCPFCGTRLKEIGPGLLSRFLPEYIEPKRNKKNQADI
jgi:hypothetical protein